jgi:hypothetical protein
MKYETSQNYQNLTAEAFGFISILFSGKVPGFENAYMVELKIDDQLEHIRKGGEGFIIHQDGDGCKKNAFHLFDENWAVVHKDDAIWEANQNNIRHFVSIATKYFFKREKDDEIIQKANYVLPSSESSVKSVDM